MHRQHKPGAYLFWALTVFLAPSMAAQTNMPGHVMEMKDQTPPDELPVPLRITGIGNSHLEITARPEAEAWFNQGLNLLHDFRDYESARAFEQAVRVDPQCAMCYWGLYKAESFYHSTAQGYAARALASAISLKDKVSQRERLYIEATAAAEEANGDKNPGTVRLSAAQLWRQIVRQYPEDIQARIFLSQVADHAETVSIIESILKENPEDSAANHYYIHALEGTDHPEQALHSAEILARLAPASGHMVHMPGHIFFRVGDYARAEQSFGAAMQVDEGYMQHQHVSPDNDWNYVHNLMYAIANLLEEGKCNAATSLSVKLTGARGELESTLYPFSARDSISRLDPRLPVALRTANWAQAVEWLQAAAAPESRPNLGFLARQLADFAAGMHAIESHELTGAEDASARFDGGLSGTTPQTKSAPRGGAPQLEIMPDALLQPLISSLSVMSLELRASLFTASGKVGEAKDLFAKAAQQEKALGYREPPNYIRPVGETEGAAMMAAGEWQEAKTAYQRALAERPQSGFALYGLALTSENSGDSAAAGKEYAAFLGAWNHADATLPQVKHAQSYLSHPQQ
jgi:tetratricopeptide (TPR) repeat protein